MNDLVKEIIEKKEAQPLHLRYQDLPDHERIRKIINEYEVEFVDLRFCDLRGKEHHVTLPQNKIDENFFKYGKAFDGSSLCGWRNIDKSDLLLVPDTSTAMLDLFCELPT